MTNKSKGPTTVGKVILVGLAGIVGWHAVGPKRRDGVWEWLAEAATAEAQRKQELEEAEWLKVMLTPLPKIETTPIQGFTLPPPEQPSAPAISTLISRRQSRP